MIIIQTVILEAENIDGMLNSNSLFLLMLRKYKSKFTVTYIKMCMV